MTDDPVAVLLRWEESGALWSVLSRRGAEVTVGLFRCDGGEEVDRITSSDPALLAFVDARSSHPDEGPVPPDAPRR